MSNGVIGVDVDVSITDAEAVAVCLATVEYVATTDLDPESFVVTLDETSVLASASESGDWRTGDGFATASSDVAVDDEASDGEATGGFFARL